jgi:hypothetical protein
MIDSIAKIARVAFDDARENVAGIVYSIMSSNIICKRMQQQIMIQDVKGEIVKGRRVREYLARWHIPDYLPVERLSLGPTGKLLSLEVVQPRNVEPEILEGGIDKDHCVFQVSAPGTMSPTYMFQKRQPITLEVNYSASGVYTRDNPPEPLSWCIRLPSGKSIPWNLDFELGLPKEKPMLTPPRIYRLNDLSKAESARTDLSLDKSDAWYKIPYSSVESHLEYSLTLDYVKWNIKPPRQNIAYKIEWDWWK